MPFQLQGSFPIRSSLSWAEMTVIVGSARSIIVDTSQPGNHYATQSTPADGDSATHNLFLDEAVDSSYNLDILGLTGPTLGLMDLYIGNDKIISLDDWYSAVATRNVRMITTGISIIGTGAHKLTTVINGKNVASADFGLQLTKIWAYKNVD